MIFPWQTTQWQQLLLTKQEDRLSHALLFLGLKGTGKTHFATCFVRAQLCHHQSTNENIECECHSCRLVLGKSHPNILWVEPEKEGSAIKIDQVRDVTEFVNQTSLQGEYRFVIINPANDMNANAANALLKTLEEPSSGSIMILISEQASQLPATILSRCQHIHFPPPAMDAALTWLAKKNSHHADLELALRLAHGAPLTAMQLIENEILTSRTNLLEILYQLSLKQNDPVKSGLSIKDLESIQIIDFILSWIIDLLKLHMQSDTSEMVNKDFISQLTDLQQRTLPKNIIQYMNYLQQLRGQIQIGINLNKQLMIESMLIRWMECASCF